MDSCDILFITSDKTEGGIQRALIDWASVILENTPYRFAAITPDNRFSRWLADYHPRAERTLLTSGGRIIMRHLPSLFRYSAAGKRANIAFVHNGFACAAARTLAQHVIGICHNDKPAHFGAADQLICLTPKSILLAKQQGWTDDRLILLPHYHDCRYDSLPVSKADTSLRVSAAGRFVGKKNFGLFISIAAAVQAQRPDIGFTLAGDGPEGASLKNMAAQTGAKIDFTGWTDMDALTSQTDIFILPSTDEPFGYVLAEMMDAGTAILSTPTSGADYMLDGGEIAPLIDADDVDKWVETILGLADDPDALAGLRNQIFSHIRKPHFSRQKFTERITGLLDSQPAR